MPSPQTPPSSSTDSRRRHGRSKPGKAQMCLLKILRIISLFPAVDDDDEVLSCNKEHLGHKRLFDVDLNIDLGEIEPLEHPAVVTVTGGGTTTTTDCGDCVFVTTNDRREITDLLCFEEKQETVTEQSEISHVGDQSSGIDFNGGELEEKVVRDEGGGGGGGYLDLLIEAAQLILGDDCEPPPYVESSKTAENGGGRKRKKHFTAEEERWYAEFEDTSPVVKSKRGRNQVLPLKYRDSVVEPLVRRTASWRKRRSSNGGVLSPARRRSKW